MNKIMGVSLGNSMFMDWEDIDMALDRWAKEYFGVHVEAVGSRDENDFEVSLGGLLSEDYEKYVQLFEVYDKEKDYEPDGEYGFGDYGTILPDGMTKCLMLDVLGDNGLKSYGTALATYNGVFFMELDRFAERTLEGKMEEAQERSASGERVSGLEMEQEGFFL